MLTQPGQTIQATHEGIYSGLVTGKPVAVINARGGAYATGAAAGLDFQNRYLQSLMGFIGFTDIREVTIERSLGPAEAVAQVEGAAIEAARAIAGRF